MATRNVQGDRQGKLLRQREPENVSSQIGLLLDHLGLRLRKRAAERAALTGSLPPGQVPAECLVPQKRICKSSTTNPCKITLFCLSVRCVLY